MFADTVERHLRRARFADGNLSIQCVAVAGQQWISRNDDWPSVSGFVALVQAERDRINCGRKLLTEPVWTHKTVAAETAKIKQKLGL